LLRAAGRLWRRLWLVGNRRSDTLRAPRSHWPQPLWLVGNRRSDTLGIEAVQSRDGLWLVGNRRSDTLSVATDCTTSRIAVACRESSLRYTTTRFTKSSG